MDVFFRGKGGFKMIFVFIGLEFWFWFVEYREKKSKGLVWFIRFVGYIWDLEKGF